MRTHVLGNVELSMGCVTKGVASDAGGIRVMPFQVCWEAWAADELGTRCIPTDLTPLPVSPQAPASGPVNVGHAVGLAVPVR